MDKNIPLTLSEDDYLVIDLVNTHAEKKKADRNIRAAKQRRMGKRHKTAIRACLILVLMLNLVMACVLTLAARINMEAGLMPDAVGIGTQLFAGLAAIACIISMILVYDGYAAPEES